MPQDNSAFDADAYEKYLTGGNSAPVPAQPAPASQGFDADAYSKYLTSPAPPAPPAAAIQQPQEQPGFWGSAKQAMGQQISGAGALMRRTDIPGGQTLEDYGKTVGTNYAPGFTSEDYNPGGKAWQQPWEATKELAGSAIGTVGPAIAAGVLTKNPLVTAAMLGAPAAGNTLQAQEAKGINDPWRAAGVGAMNAALAFLPVGAVGRLLAKPAEEAAAKTAEEAGTSLVAKQPSLTKRILGTAAEQAAIMPALTAGQRWGTEENLTSPEAMKQYVGSAIQGGVMGGIFGVLPARSQPKDILAGDKAPPPEEAGAIKPLGLPQYSGVDGQHAVFSDGSTMLVGEAKRQGVDLTGATILPTEHAQAYSDILKATQPPLPEGQLPIPKVGTNMPKKGMKETPAQTWAKMAPEDTPTFPAFKELSPGLADRAQKAIKNLDPNNPASMRAFEDNQQVIHAISEYMKPITEGGDKADSYSNMSKMVNKAIDPETRTLDRDKLLGALLDRSIDTSEKNPNAPRFRNAAKALGGMDDDQLAAAIKAREEPIQKGATNEKAAEAKPVETQQPEAPAAGATESVKENQNAIPEQGAGGVLQRPQEGLREAWGERGRVEQGKQGVEAAPAREAAVKTVTPETATAGKEAAAPGGAGKVETGVVSKNRIELKDVSSGNREIVKDVMGWDDQGNMVNKPMSLREAAAAFERREDRPISHTSIANRLKAEGFDADVMKEKEHIETATATPISQEQEHALVSRKENNTGMGVVESPGASQINTGAGKGWKGLLAAKVPFNDRRWTNDMLAEAAAKKSQLMEPIAKEMASRERLRMAKVESLKGKAEAEEEHPHGADEERDIWAEAHGDETYDIGKTTERLSKELEAKKDLDFTKSVKENKPVFGASKIKGMMDAAVKRGDITPVMRDFAGWFIDKNPSLLSQLGGVVREAKKSELDLKTGKAATRGQYDPFFQVMSLIKGTDSGTTAVHEILHHMETLMPKEMQDGIRNEYRAQLANEIKAARIAGDTARQEYLANAQKRLFTKNIATANNLAKKMIKSLNAGDVGGKDYRYFDPSEFWAVKMTDALVDRYNTGINNKGLWEKAKQWLSEALQHIRGALGMTSDSPMLKALDKLLKSGNGEERKSSLLKSAVIKSVDQEAHEAATSPKNKLPEPTPKKEDTHAQDRAAMDFAGAKTPLDRRADSVDTMLKGAVDRVQKAIEKTPIKNIKGKDLGWYTKLFIEHVANHTPGLKTFSAHIKENMRVDELMNQVQLEITKQTAPFAKEVERLQNKVGRAAAQKINSKMGALAQESSLRGLDPRASWEENLARNPGLKKRETEESFKEFKQRYNNFEHQHPELAKAIGGAHSILGDLYSKSMATRLANFIRGSTKGELKDYVDTLDYRNLPKGTTADSSVNRVFDAARTLPADSEMRQQMTQFERIYKEQIRDPYFHLGRSGDYFARIRLNDLDTATHKALADILEKHDRGATDLKSMKEDGIFLRTETMDEAGALRRQLAAAAGDHLEKDSDQHGLIAENLHSTVGLAPVMRSILNSMQEHIDSLGLSKDQATALKQAATRDFMSMLPETSSKKAMMRRKGVAGYDNEFLKNFSTRVQGMSQDLSSIYTAHQYAKNFKDIDNAINGPGGLSHTGSGSTQVRAQQIANELQRRHINSMQPTRGDWVNMLNSFGHAFYLAMSPAFILRTMFQPWHRGLPLLGGQYGYAQSAKALMGASGDVTKIITGMLARGWKEGGLRGVLEAGLDMSKTNLSPEEKAFFQEGMDRGKWNIGQTDTLLRMAQSKGSLHGDITRFVSIAAQIAEMTNRMIAGLADHRLSKGDTEHALKMSERVMDTFDPTANARMIGRFGFAGKMTPLYTSFMSYNLQTMQQLYMAAHDGMFNKDMSAEGKLRSKQAKKEFAGLMATTTMLSGVMGLPFMSAVAGLYNWLVKDEDHPGDVRGDIQNFLKHTFGGQAGEMISHGLSRGIGVDLSTTGMQNLLPGSDFLADRHLFKDRLQSQAISTLGPAANAGIDVAAALARISDGYYMKGLEAALPSGLKPEYKVGELLAKGYTDSLGNPISIKATPWDVMVQASGFTPADKARYQEAHMIHTINEERLSHRKQILTDMAYKALSSKDHDEWNNKVLPEIQDFNKANPTMAITSMRNIFQQHAMRVATGQLPGMGVGVTSMKEFIRAKADTDFADIR